MVLLDLLVLDFLQVLLVLVLRYLLVDQLALDHLEDRGILEVLRYLLVL